MPDVIDCPSPNHDERMLPIDMLVLHYTGMESGQAALDRLRDPDARVSAHYLLMEDGQLVRMVDEDRRAWHAGRSHWRGITDVNSASVGIEIVNPGHEHGYRPFTPQQMSRLVPLVAEIVERHRIEPGKVVGHSDIAPTRKTDPGELFDWEALARVRLAVPRPKRNLIDPEWSDPSFLLALERYGYDVADGPAAVRAFQRRFRQEQVDGLIDGECRAILFRLLVDEGARG